MASKTHPIFIAIKRNNKLECMRLVNEMHPDELATLKNTGNTSLTTVTIDTMNVHLLEKLIDVCQHKIITDLKKRFKVLIKNLDKIVPEARANLITKLLEYNDFDIFIASSILDVS